jgi:transposase-like protein
MNKKGSDREVERLLKEIEKLRRENEELEKKLDKVKKEFEEYKARHPETVGVKHGKPYVIRSSNTSPLPKKPGARKGHKPHFRPMPKQIDDVCPVPVLACPLCEGTDLSDVQEVRERTIEDIVIPRPRVTRYAIERRYCRHCKKLVETPVTAALSGARLGIRVMLVVVWLKIKLRLTEEAIPELLEKLFGLKISEGEVVHILAQIANAFGPYYEQLVQEIRKAPARYIDETSWRINGKNVWLWAFVTKGEALYKIALRRNHNVPLDVLGEKHNGVDVHDRFSAYKALARKTGNTQQDCWAHIINDTKELAQFYGEEGEHIHQVIKKTYECAKAYDHKGTDEDIEKLFQDMADELNRPYKSQHCHKFVVNLLKEKDNLFEFVKNPEVDGTNNAAERAIRPAVVARKISGGSRSPRGAEIYERLISVIHTLRARDQNILEHGPLILATSHG